MSAITAHLLQLFQAHGVEAEADGEWVRFPGRDMKAGAGVAEERRQGEVSIVQLGVRFDIAPWRTIVESFAGFGGNTESAVADAFHNFTVNSFHVLLAAFFRRDDKQVSQEEWVIGGRKSRLTIGNMGVRGQPPVQGQGLVAWVEQFRERVKEKALGPGTHWLRVYYAQMEGKATACEVLRNNEVWDEMQSEMASVDWPSGEAFYSVRVFLIVQGENAPATTPEGAVVRLAEIVAPRAEFGEDEIYAAMAEAGIPGPVADRAYKLLQTAWGRAFLRRLKVQLSSDYIWFNGAGDVVESGPLESDPYFVAAWQLAGQYAGSPGFQRLAVMSADVHAVNSLLQRGSKPENCVTSTAAFFLEAPTPVGRQKAMEMLRQKATAAAPKPPAPVKKPWWQFWS